MQDKWLQASQILENKLVNHIRAILFPLIIEVYLDPML